jgi:hypothetical protein
MNLFGLRRIPEHVKEVIDQKSNNLYRRVGKTGNRKEEYTR